MLRLKNIKKSYTTAGFTQNALDGVSVAFRENEFAAILGPSGSGKTTMLNVIGGLDLYDSGELVIDNISTENYKASDWDTYRNNRIGFVFQSYNLIPHQTVLSNVELALTLSGVSKAERRERAKKALEEVGLGDHIRKKPSQLSGGQMQRVAIARAIINDPEILLADEPTGALDTKTGKQVMELLTRIAKTRLVIMVTHNNELAEEHATRIIHLTDGKVKSDSRPMKVDAKDRKEGSAARKASMSFLTAIMLSFSNLMTKKGRTITTAFAGSIGIIGIAVILAFSNGINEYIRTMEEETLSLYPLAIQEVGFDLSGFFGGDGEHGGGGEPREEPPTGIRELRLVERAFSTQNANDLASLKTYFQENAHIMDRYTSTIHYTFDVTPQIFLSDTSNGVDQVNPDQIFSEMMGPQAAMGGGGMGFMPGMNVFFELPNNPELYEPQYDLLAGYWPQNYDEAVLVVSHSGRTTDFVLYSMGIRDRSEMRAMFEAFVNMSDEEIEMADPVGQYSFEELMAASFRVVYQNMFFEYDETFNVWVDKRNDEEFMIDLLENSFELRIVGIVRPSQDATATVIGDGIGYTPQLIQHLMEQAAGTEIVREQLANPEVNVLTGNTFEDERENLQDQFDFSRIISVDEDIFREALDFESMFASMDFEDMEMDFANIDMGNMNFGNINFNIPGFDMNNFDMSGLDLSNIDLSGFDFDNIDFDNIDFGNLDLNIEIPDISPEFDIGALVAALASALAGDVDEAVLAGAMQTIMQNFLIANPIANFIVIDPNTMLPTVDAAALSSAFFAYLMNDVVWQDIMVDLGISATELEAQIARIIQDFMVGAMQGYMAQMTAIITQAIQTAMRTAIEAAMQSMMQGVMDSVVRSITDQIGAAMQTTMAQLGDQISAAMQTAMRQVGTQISRQMERAMSQVAEQIQESIQDIFDEMAGEMETAMEGFDGEALAEAFNIEMGEEEILDLMMSIMNPSVTSYEQTLSMLGFADPAVPSQILIYPLSFDAKQEVLDILEQYNQRMEAAGKDDQVVHFTDFVGMMMATVTEIVDMVSYALVAFVSVALVVSSIMIGVITFISVLERKKEIGILRAVGASKGNIRLVFNAETLIIGFVAGVIGVLATYGIVIIANIILNNLLGIEQLVILPLTVPPILVGISMFLTYIAGLMPASVAAQKPPVEALRSE